MTLHPPKLDRVQTGVRMERRLVKVLTVALPSLS
jgi:hypothetical protein